MRACVCVCVCVIIDSMGSFNHCVFFLIPTTEQQKESVGGSRLQSFEGRFECEVVSHSNGKHKRNQALKIATGMTLRQDYT